MMEKWIPVILLALAAGRGPVLHAAAPGAPPPPAAEAEPAGPPRLFPELSGGRAWDAFQAGARFLDARAPGDYGRGHVPGAINLPIWADDFDHRLAAFLAGPHGQPGLPAVVYCSGCCSPDSLLLAQRLKEAGFAAVQIYRDGYPGWARAGHPNVRGLAPLEVN